MQGQILILLTAFIATILSTVVGFGSRILIIAVLTLFIGIKEAIFIATLFSILEYVMKTVYFRSYINVQLAARLCSYMIPGIALGLFVFKYLDVHLMQILFSLFILAYIPYSLVKIKVKHHLGQFWLFLLMFIFGFLESVIGSGGPLLASILIYEGNKRHKYIALASILFLVSALIRIFGYHMLRTFNVEYLFMIYLFLITAAGIYIGEKLLKKLPAGLFNYVVLFVLLLVALKNLV